MQMYVAAATAQASGDPEFAEEIRAAWSKLWDLIRLRLGSDHETGDFMGTGMLITVLLAMGFPQDHRAWASCDMTLKVPTSPH
jgi:hypothetical protein